jgi:signal transduction histidine kinase
VREEESKRLAREIHDRLGQALTALRFDFNSLIGELPGGAQSPPKRAESIVKLIDETIQSVRRISGDLRPGMLDDLGLVSTVEWAGEQFQERSGVKCRLDLPQKDLAIEAELATAIYRILQEALTNITRHAAASDVLVRLSKKNRDLVLVVQDNGKGMPPTATPGRRSLGILGMQERALIFGGDVVVSSSPGEGTTVTARIPDACRK